jgi:hypothetical protein
VASGNVELVRRGYEAFNRGDLDAAFELLDPDEIEIVVGHMWTVRDGKAVRFEGSPSARRPSRQPDVRPSAEPFNRAAPQLTAG